MKAQHEKKKALIFHDGKPVRQVHLHYGFITNKKKENIRKNGVKKERSKCNSSLNSENGNNIVKNVISTVKNVISASNNPSRNVISKTDTINCTLSNTTTNNHFTKANSKRTGSTLVVAQEFGHLSKEMLEKLCADPKALCTILQKARDFEDNEGDFQMGSAKGMLKEIVCNTGSLPENKPTIYQGNLCIWQGCKQKLVHEEEFTCFMSIVLESKERMWIDLFGFMHPNLWEEKIEMHQVRSHRPNVLFDGIPAPQIIHEDDAGNALSKILWTHHFTSYEDIVEFIKHEYSNDEYTRAMMKNLEHECFDRWKFWLPQE
jgi:hypothetical protein